MRSDNQPHSETAPKQPSTAGRSISRERALALALLIVAAVFCGVIIGALAVMHLSEFAGAPDSPTLQALRAALQKDSGNEDVKMAIREQDLRLREQYFTNRRRMQLGAYLLLVGAVAAVICARWYAVLGKRPPMPLRQAERNAATRWFGARRRTIIAAISTIIVLTLAWFGISLAGRPALPPEPPSPVVAPPSPPVEPPPAAKENWPRFRGPDGLGIAPAGDWPREWDVAKGTNVIWNQEVPLAGKSSPIIWGDRIFLTGANAAEREVFCFSRSTGDLLWRTPVRTALQDPQNLTVTDQTGYAASTPATDGARVYALFATADLAAVDFSGTIVWTRNLGAPENNYGLAVSPILYDGKLIIQFDRGGSADDKLSAIMALDPATGNTLWQTPRPVPNSWGTPIVAQTEKEPQIITCGDPWVIAYDPRTGSELWRANALASDDAPSPVFAQGLVYVTTQNGKVAAIRAGGQGDVTKSNIVWTGHQGMSDASSPVTNGKFYLQAQSAGEVTCYDAESGKLLWDHWFNGAFWSSPSIVGDLVYLPGEDGKVYLIKLSPTFELVGEANAGEPVYASPAFVDSRIYMRTEKHLLCIGKVGS